MSVIGYLPGTSFTTNFDFTVAMSKCYVGSFLTPTEAFLWEITYYNTGLLENYDAPAFENVPGCSQTINYTATVFESHSGFINTSDGKNVSWQSSVDTDVNSYLIWIGASTICAYEVFESYTLEVKSICEIQSY